MEYTDRDKDAGDRDSSSTTTESRDESRPGTKREQSSTDADAGAAPEASDRGVDGMKQGGKHRDPAATYEPDKKPGDRNTL
jgi:hypothetical protein